MSMKQKPLKPNDSRILIASNGDGDAQKLAAALGARGYAVLVVPGGRDFIDTLRNDPPDVVILDAASPDAEGCQACSLIKADAGLKEIPVLFIVSPGDDRAGLLAAGAADFIAKPIEPPEALARVSMHLELVQRGRELEQCRARLLDSERLRDNFVHMLAHDLRNTLTAISGYLELIGMTGRETLPEKGLQYVKKGTDSVSTLVETLNTMLDVSKMGSGNLQPNFTRFDLVAVIGKVLSDIEPRGNRTEFVLPEPGFHAEVMGDQDLIRRTAHNLVSSALKSAGKENRVKVAIEDRADCVRVFVHDRGPAIPPDRLGRLFAGFGEAQGASSGKTYSQGLGFTFCRLAVEAHGGRISAESSPDTGNTFWFELLKNP